RLRPAVEQCQILPPKGDGPRPRAPFPEHGPHAILPWRDGAPDPPRAAPPPDLAVNGRPRGVPPREIGSPAAAKRPSDEKQTERFEEIGFALSVGTDDYAGGGGGRIGKRRITTKFRQLYPFNLHPRFAPPRAKSRPKSAWAL